MCGVSAGGFASFLCHTDKGLEEHRQGGPYTSRKSSLAREGSDLSGKNLPGQLERGVGDGEGFVIGRGDGTVVSDQGRRTHSRDGTIVSEGGEYGTRVPDGLECETT